MIKVFENQNGAATSKVVYWGGGIGSVLATGTITATLQVSIDNGTTWSDVGDDSLSNAGGFNFSLPFGCLVRLNATAATAANAVIGTVVDKTHDYAGGVPREYEDPLFVT